MTHMPRGQICELMVGGKATFSRPIPPQSSPVPHALRNYACRWLPWNRLPPDTPLQSQSRPQIQLWQIEPKNDLEEWDAGPWCGTTGLTNLACVRLTRNLP